MVESSAAPSTESSAVERTAHTFHGLGIAANILRILDRLKFTVPTPIQHAAIPSGIEGIDVVGIAQTGTGKTLAFGVPMVQRLRENMGRGLVIVPTRELALQVEETLRKIGRPLGLNSVVLIGGAPIGRQRMLLRASPQMIIATPGRLIDHLESGTVELHNVKILVLDEADRMLDMGFAPQIARILRAVPEERQTMLFSATMPAEIVELATSYMHLPVRVEVAVPGSTADEITQELFVVPKEGKTTLLEKLLLEYPGPILIFSRTRHGAHRILRDVKGMGHTVAELHSDRSLSQRREALDGFKSGQYRILVATDIAARGIDVTGIQLVLNYDIPDQAEDYVHRVGRTGRAGRTGHAITLATPDQASEVRSIEKLIRTALPVSEESEHELEIPVSGARRRPRSGPPRDRTGSSQRRPPTGARRPPSGDGSAKADSSESQRRLPADGSVRPENSESQRPSSGDSWRPRDSAAGESRQTQSRPRTARPPGNRGPRRDYTQGSGRAPESRSSSEQSDNARGSRSSSTDSREGRPRGPRPQRPRQEGGPRPSRTGGRPRRSRPEDS